METTLKAALEAALMDYPVVTLPQRGAEATEAAAKIKPDILLGFHTPKALKDGEADLHVAIDKLNARMSAASQAVNEKLTVTRAELDAIVAAARQSDDAIRLPASKIFEAEQEACRALLVQITNECAARLSAAQDAFRAATQASDHTTALAIHAAVKAYKTKRKGIWDAYTDQKSAAFRDFKREENTIKISLKRRKITLTSKGYAR